MNNKIIKEDILSKLYIYLFPLIFIPDLGFTRNTIYGSIDPSDYILPFLYFALFVSFIIKRRLKVIVRIPTLITYFLFIIVASFSTILIPIRYPDLSNPSYFVFFGFLKLAKFFLYASFGWFIHVILYTPSEISKFKKSVIYGGLIIALPIIYTGLRKYNLLKLITINKSFFPYESLNAISVALGGLICYGIGNFLYFEKKEKFFQNF